MNESKHQDWTFPQVYFYFYFVSLPSPPLSK